MPRWVHGLDGVVGRHESITSCPTSPPGEPEAASVRGPSPGGLTTPRCSLAVAASAALLVAACGGSEQPGDAGDGAGCVSYMRFQGETYFPQAAVNLPVTEKAMTSELPVCTDTGFPDVPPEDIEVSILDGVDPSVALGQRAARARGADVLWIAIGDTPTHDVPQKLRQYLAR